MPLFSDFYLIKERNASSTRISMLTRTEYGFHGCLVANRKKGVGIQNRSCYMFTGHKFCIHNTGKPIMFLRVSEPEPQLTKVGTVAGARMRVKSEQEPEFK